MESTSNHFGALPASIGRAIIEALPVLEALQFKLGELSVTLPVDLEARAALDDQIEAFRTALSTNIRELRQSMQRLPSPVSACRSISVKVSAPAHDI